MDHLLDVPPDLAALPTPDVAGEWKPFWDAASERRLMIQQCPACDRRQFYPRAICTACGAEPEWREASGRGTLYTFSIVRQNLVRPFKDMLPYVLAMVDLHEGVRMLTNIVGCDLDEVRIGMPLQVTFVQAKDGLHLPYWRPRTTV